ncbi:hypothetical protein [Thermostaphylospora chromogena]|uniref:PknH-like extracellular domain-containing protein n=1 Tax=Thermostaphylospora chromogena TaxID=35622 RepID=A0A1H1GED6_9ACTN|nr:hypothetical protein [Thermostaphylospora chromogena]SDR11541.1 hypothetical protein SAMN04489764_3540 [Thermostaphylospora chromogena]
MFRRTVIAVAGAVCVLLVAAGVVWLTSDDPPRPAVFRGEPTTDFYAPIGTRELDPEPLAAHVLFAADRLTSGSVELVRQTTEELADCADAVWGAAADAVDGCTQALRAVYATPDGAVAAQSVVLNLPDGASADRLVAALGPGGGFVRQAPGLPEGFDGARGWAQAQALGHYVAVSWVAPVGGGGRVDLTAHQVALNAVTRTLHDRIVEMT